MARKWKGLFKAAEECNELGVELMKLANFPSGKHPGRKKSLVISTEDECADVLAAVEYFIAKNRLDMTRIQARKQLKIKKFIRWWGEVKPVKKAKTKSTPKAKSIDTNAR